MQALDLRSMTDFESAGTGHKRSLPPKNRRDVPTSIHLRIQLMQCQEKIEQSRKKIPDLDRGDPDRGTRCLIAYPDTSPRPYFNSGSVVT
jgi:hypothetical protein